MTDAQFRDLQVLIRQEAGIHLEPAKRSLLIARLSRRMRVLGVRSFGEYYDRVCGDDGGEKRQMIDAICTNETHFFRDVRQFDFFRTVVLPDIERKSDRIRIWSAGCSTGEEPYSLAMAALDVLGSPPRREIEILASDRHCRFPDRFESTAHRCHPSGEPGADLASGRHIRSGRSSVGLGNRCDRRDRSLDRRNGSTLAGLARPALRCARNCRRATHAGRIHGRVRATARSRLRDGGQGGWNR